MIYCPHCEGTSRTSGSSTRRCNLCGYTFLNVDGLTSRKIRTERKERHIGQKAGRITIGRGSFWGAGLA